MLSIVIPIYNTEKTLKRCLDSIRNQLYNDYEVIMVNDGSKDSSEYIAKEYSGIDSRFNYIVQDNSGPGAARNKGIDLAKGEYVIFVDADDWLDDNYLSTIMSYENHNYDALIWGFTEEWNDHKQVVVPVEFASHDTSDILYKLYELKKNVQYGMSWNCRFRREILNKYNIRMSLDVKLHEDCIFSNWYFHHVKSLKVLPYSGYHYVHPEGESLCRRKHYPSDETYSMALQMYKSITPWINVPQLGNFEIYNYLSKLSLSVLDMYKKEDFPRKNKNERIKRISFVKYEISRYYKKLNIKKKTHYLFHYVPTPLIDIIYRVLV